MLILTRKVDQGIVISGNILIRVLAVEHSRVTIGISAPRDVTILREELFRKGEENQRFEVHEGIADGSDTVESGPST